VKYNPVCSRPGWRPRVSGAKSQVWLWFKLRQGQTRPAAETHVGHNLCAGFETNVGLLIDIYGKNIH